MINKSQSIQLLFSSFVDQGNVLHHGGRHAGREGPGDPPGVSEGGPGSWRQSLWSSGSRHPGY